VREALVRDGLADHARIQRRAQQDTAHALAHEELCVVLAHLLVALHVEQDQIEAPLIEPAHHPSQHRGVKCMCHGDFLRKCQSHVRSDAAPHFGYIAIPVRDRENQLACLGTDQPLVVQRPRDRADRNPRLLGNLANGRHTHSTATGLQMCLQLFLQVFLQLFQTSDYATRPRMSTKKSQESQHHVP
jgi:hypothetical protein